LGKDLLLSLHEVADNSLREIAIKKSTRHIDYLMQQLNKVTVSDYRQVLIENLSAQEKSRMLASSGLFFAAEPLGVPTAPRVPTNPKPALVLSLSVVMGLFTGILIALLRVWLKTPARKTIK
jgi:LPS O-antigen subunit length determinant protein (WzzB/FepE family)